MKVSKFTWFWVFISAGLFFFDVYLIFSKEEEPCMHECERCPVGFASMEDMIQLHNELKFCEKSLYKGAE